MRNIVWNQVSESPLRIFISSIGWRNQKEQRVCFANPNCDLLPGSLNVLPQDTPTILNPVQVWWQAQKIPNPTLNAI